MADPEATLYGSGNPEYFDPNATMVGQPGYFDPNATLVGIEVNGVPQMMTARSAQGTVPHLTMIPSSEYFQPVDIDVTRTIKFGRGDAETANDPDFITFPSKVVSRRHAEIWVSNGEFYIRDTKSQSGTFLNAMRLSMPGDESKPFKIKSGDVIQFGVDRRGSDDDNLKCVCMTIECSYRPRA